MSYLLDTDVFIRAKNLHYGFEFCPAFWDWLIAANLERRVFSIEKIYNELLEVEDELSMWADARTEKFFLPPNAQVLSALAEVSTWVSSQSYTQSAITTFLQVADYYLVAQAFADKHTVVTHEIPSASTRRIKIPDACIGLGIKCITPFEMLRRERVRFVLATPP